VLLLQLQLFRGTPAQAYWWRWDNGNKVYKSTGSCLHTLEEKQRTCVQRTSQAPLKKVLFMRRRRKKTEEKLFEDHIVILLTGSAAQQITHASCHHALNFDGWTTLGMRADQRFASTAICTYSKFPEPIARLL
jgi:hypothetical protein